MAVDCAVIAGSDLRRRVRQLSAIWESAQAGELPRSGLRPLIAESWERVRRSGLDPRLGRDPDIHDRDEVEQLRHESGIDYVLDVLRGKMASLADDGTHIMVIANAQGSLLWQEGNLAVRLQAGSIGFVEGALWDESTGGTSGIGTTLVAQRPLQIFAGEHYLRNQHPWVCSAAPLRDPVDGRLLGVVDIGGPAATAHPSTVALVSSVARQAETMFRARNMGALERLRHAAAPLIAKLSEPVLITDRNGWVAVARDVVPPDRVLLPEPTHGGPAHIPPFGLCQIEPLSSGWMIRVDDGSCRPTGVRLEMAGADPAISITASTGVSRHRLSPRHAEILLALALATAGRSATELSADLYGDSGHTGAIRAEMCRLRRRLGCLLRQRPYGFQPWLEVTCDLPDDPAALMPGSAAPFVRRLRASG